MKLKLWIDGTLKHLPALVARPENPGKIFGYCDVLLENDSREQGWVSILANASGRYVVQDLFPDLPIRWHRSPLFPFGWSTADLFVSRMIAISNAHKLPEPPPASQWVLTDSQIVRRLARGAMDYGCRVGLRDGKKYCLID